MKAESAVLVAVQRPLTVFGLPAALLAGLIGAAALLFGSLAAAGWLATGFALALALVAAGWVKVYRATRRDPHFSHALLLIPRFWGRRQYRTLIAGLPGGAIGREDGGV